MLIDVGASMQDPATIAWNLSTTSFYKIGGKPWRLAELRDGVCYVGLVFKRIERPSGRDNARIQQFNRSSARSLG